MAKAAQNLLFISLAIVAIATTQGGSNKFKIIKENAAIGVNIVLIPAITSSSLSGLATPFKMAKVPMACSLAISALTTATALFQLPNPSGAKIQAIILPSVAIILSSISSTISKEKLNLERNHITMQAVKMIVPALMIKPLDLSHI